MSNQLEQLKEAAPSRRAGAAERASASHRARLAFACLLVALTLARPFDSAAQQPQPHPTADNVRPATTTGEGLLKAPNAPARPASPAAAPRRPAKPAPPVIAVVHRLRGWTLRALVTPLDAPFASTFDDKFVRVSVVAGYVLADGRSVVARLPRAEAEMLNFSAMFPEFPHFQESSAQTSDSALVLLKPDGTQSPAKFVGFDSATGLSLLEASAPVLNVPQEARAESPAVGERVRLVAPLPTEVAEALAATEAEAQKRATKDEAAGDGRPVGVTGVLYMMSLAEIEGRLIEVSRSPAGRAVGLTLQFDLASSPEWAGSVALTEAGALAGIVEQSRGREARLLSAEVVRAAAERVQKRRASVPQPWLGARGDAVAGSELEFFTQRGWPRAQAGELLRRQHGVLLTSVAPDSPASRAGLRAGDVVSRIDNFEVRGVEDMSLLLRETRGLAEFTIHRANESPRSFRVRLSETQNPALATARAEARAAEAEKQQAESTLRRLDDDARRVDEAITVLEETLRKANSEGRDATAAATERRAGALKQLDELRRKLAELRARQTSAETEFVRRRARLEEANARVRAATGGPGAASAFRPLLPFGVKAMLYMTSVEVAGRAVSDHGLAVLEVDPESAAARGGLKAGDVIETIDGQAPHALDLTGEPPAALTDEPSLAVRRGGQRFNLKLNRAPH